MDHFDTNKVIINKNIFPNGLYLNLSGGGYGSFYQAGAVSVLKILCERYHTKINKIFCTSCGSVISVLLLTAFHDPSIDVASFTKMFRDVMKNEKYITENIHQILIDKLPENIHEIANNRLVVSLYVIDFMRIRKVRVSEFKDKMDLIDAVVASCTIPMITSRGLWTWRNQYAFDGFTSVPDEPVIYINALKCGMSYKDLFVYNDHNTYESYSWKGIIETERFLNDQNYHPKALYMYTPKKKLRTTYKILIFIVYICIFLYYKNKKMYESIHKIIREQGFYVFY
jgi:hypothetical protein